MCFAQAPPYTPVRMLVATDFLGAVKAVAAEQRFWPQPPTAWHDELLARRHAERRPRVISLTTRLMSSLDFPAERDSNRRPPPASLDELLARRHAERPPHARSLAAKLMSSLDLIG
ncbi:hypothetical protein T484DRAFT_1876434 [Baffinella frigidus]|nr:hypothetical protein T484DRAFT_1876434 [Cryptophyta sp. CCMP2293]